MDSTRPARRLEVGRRTHRKHPLYPLPERIRNNAEQGSAVARSEAPLRNTCPPADTTNPPPATPCHTPKSALSSTRYAIPAPRHPRQPAHKQPAPARRTTRIAAHTRVRTNNTTIAPTRAQATRASPQNNPHRGTHPRADKQHNNNKKTYVQYKRQHTRRFRL